MLRSLRVRAQWTRLSLGCVRPHHLIGSDALFHPRFQSADPIEGEPAAAVSHCGDHEEAHPVVLLLAHFVEHGVVVPDAGFRRDPRIGPAVSDQQLSTARLEFAQVRIHGIHVAFFLVDDLEVPVKIEIVPVVVRVIVRNANEVERAAG